MPQPCNGVYKRLKTDELFRHDGHGDRRLSRGAVPGSGIVGSERLEVVSVSMIGRRSRAAPRHLPKPVVANMVRPIECSEG
jgi:hypothetical protein